ncbi:hypothetical protein ADUPG1_010298, partial [Aduncisulcus paluster]
NGNAYSGCGCIAEAFLDDPHLIHLAVGVACPHERSITNDEIIAEIEQGKSKSASDKQRKKLLSLRDQRVYSMVGGTVGVYAERGMAFTACIHQPHSHPATSSQLKDTSKESHDSLEDIPLLSSQSISSEHIPKEVDGCIAFDVSSLREIAEKSTMNIASTFALLQKLGLGCGIRALKYEARMKVIKNTFMGEGSEGSWFYIFQLGARLRARGKGVGSCLMRSVLNLADNIGLPIALETQKARNVKMYERYGFRTVLKEKTFAGEGVMNWFMIRPINGIWDHEKQEEISP